MVTTSSGGCCSPRSPGSSTSATTGRRLYSSEGGSTRVSTERPLALTLSTRLPQRSNSPLLSARSQPSLSQAKPRPPSGSPPLLVAGWAVAPSLLGLLTEDTRQVVRLRLGAGLGACRGSLLWGLACHGGAGWGAGRGGGFPVKAAPGRGSRRGARAGEGSSEPALGGRRCGVPGPQPTGRQVRGAGAGLGTCLGRGDAGPGRGAAGLAPPGGCGTKVSLVPLAWSQQCPRGR